MSESKLREAKRPRKKYEPPLKHWLGGNFGATLRDLQTLPPDVCGEINAALLAWAQHMAQVNPPVFAAYLYAALGDTWEWNRRNLYPGPNVGAMAPPGSADDLTIRHHGTFLHALALAQKDERAVRFYERAGADLTLRPREVPDETPAEVPDDAPDELPAGNVVDFSCWTQSHARPIRNLLFAEKGGE